MIPHFAIKNVLSNFQIDYIDNIVNKFGDWCAKNYSESFTEENNEHDVDKIIIGGRFRKIKKHRKSKIRPRFKTLPATLLHDTYEKYLSSEILQKIYDMVAPHTEKYTGKLYPTIGTVNVCLKPMNPHVDLVPAHRDFDKDPMYSILIPLPSTANSTTLVWNTLGSAPINTQKIGGKATAYENKAGHIICFKRQLIHGSGPFENGVKRFINVLTRRIC